MGEGRKFVVNEFCQTVWFKQEFFPVQNKDTMKTSWAYQAYYLNKQPAQEFRTPTQLSPLEVFYVALRPRRRDNLLGTGTEWERGQGDWLDRGNRPKKTGETVDRRQNNGSVKAVSPRHCPATCALRNCSFNCCAGQSH